MEIFVPKQNKEEYWFMNKTVYIQANKSADIVHSKVYIGDLTQVVCQDKKLEKACRELLVIDLIDELPGSYVVNAADLVNIIKSAYDECEITLIGTPETVIKYEPEQKQNKFIYYMKIIGICLIVFFGAGFSIMTFNTDVGCKELFASLYQEMTGRISDGFTELEFFYSLGIGIGVIFFFNHFSFRKKKGDPSALEVKMSTYEGNVMTTILDQEAKKTSS